MNRTSRGGDAGRARPSVITEAFAPTSVTIHRSATGWQIFSSPAQSARRSEGVTQHSCTDFWPPVAKPVQCFSARYSRRGEVMS